MYVMCLKYRIIVVAVLTCSFFGVLTQSLAGMSAVVAVQVVTVSTDLRVCVHNYVNVCVDAGVGMCPWVYTHTYTYATSDKHNSK